VPAAGHQPTEQRLAAGGLVHMEWLGIVGRGELPDGPGVHRVRAGDEALSDGQVLEIQLVHAGQDSGDVLPGLEA